MKQQTQQQRRQRLDNCMFGLAVVAGLSLLLVLATVAYFVINPIDGPPTRLQIEVLVCNSRHCINIGSIGQWIAPKKHNLAMK